MNAVVQRREKGGGGEVRGRCQGLPADVAQMHFFFLKKKKERERERKIEEKRKYGIMINNEMKRHKQR